jgi:transposase InsO family protein
VQRFTPLLTDAARFCRHAPGDRWFVDETYVKVNGVWRYVYRAVDQDGQVIDVLVAARRDAAAARRFFRRALATLKVRPTEVITDAAPVYPAVLDELVPSAWHHVERHANKGYVSAELDRWLIERGVRLLRPSYRNRIPRPDEHLLKPIRQLIESVNDTLKGQLDLELHGGRSIEGVGVRVAQRLLAMTAAIWHNRATGQPVTRSLIAYDH